MPTPFEPTLATRLRRGDTVIGSVITLPSVPLAEVTATGVDFVWIDLEHGSLGGADVHPLAVASRAARAGAIARLSSHEDARLTAILDAGVDGVAVPHVETATDMHRLADRLRHPPRGSRGYASRRAVAYRPLGAEERPDPLLIAQIESPSAVHAAAEIAAVESVDALVVGCADLALALGGVPDPTSSWMREAIGRVQAAAAGAGIVSGVAGPDNPELLVELGNGVSTVFVCSADVRTYARAAGGQVEALRRAALAPASPTEEAHAAD